MRRVRAPGRLQKLSREFDVHCGKDASKRCVLFSKLVLRSLNVWPDDDDPKKYWLMMIVIFNVFVVGMGHLAYVIINLAQITKMTIACTTVLVTFETRTSRCGAVVALQCVAKLLTLVVYRAELNGVLTSIWLDFWPTSMVAPSLRASIRLRGDYVTVVGATFLCMAFVSNSQFMMFPLVHDVAELPWASWYPFDFRASPVYEALYVWQWFMSQVVVATLAGFDAFFNAVVMICAQQFRVLQAVLASVGTRDADRFWRVVEHFGEEEDKRARSTFDMRLLVKCVRHHLNLIEICDVMERIFAHIVFIQFIVSASGMCVSCVALVADPDVWKHMLSYLVAHTLQFFVYCSVGDELTHQSGRVAEAAYDCGWEASADGGFRHGLLMVIQRAQRPMALTVAGLMQLSYDSFVATVHLSFSFYVLLDSFV